MLAEAHSTPLGDPVPSATPPAFYPSTRTEFITLLAHYHRAEIARMAGWRDRIDRTTNWAITVVAAMLSVSLSTATSHHGVLIFGMLLVLLLLNIEARRYRFFDVYRGRVRRLERNYYAQILSPENEVETGWTRTLGEDLRRPTFLISRKQALSRRLRRNYVWLFLILLLAWFLKITSAKMQQAQGLQDDVLSPWEYVQNASVGPMPGWLVIVGVGLFYAWLLRTALRAYVSEGELAYGAVHV